MIIELPIHLWMLAALAVAVGSFFQGIIGYGVALFSAPLLYLIHPSFVPAPIIIVGGVLPILVLRENYRHVVWGDLRFTLSGSIAGVFTAWLVAGLLTTAAWDIIFGGLILSAVAVSVVTHLSQRSRKKKTTGPGGLAIVTGAYGTGLMGTITGVGGPPIGLAYQHVSPARMRGSLSMTFIPASIVSLLALASIGRFSPLDVVTAILLIPGMLVGFAFSKKVGPRLSPQWVAGLLLTMSAVAGAYAMVRNVV